MHNSTFIVLITLFVLNFNLHCKIDSNELKPRYGVFFNYGLNIHNATFDQLPGVPSCCQSYENGYGLGPSIGLVYDHIFDEKYSIRVRLSYDYHGGDLYKDENINLIIDGKSTNGIFSHELNTDLDIISLNPLFAYSINENFKVLGGLSLGIFISDHFDYIEKIKEPSNRGTFENGLRYRNQASGEISSLNSFQLGLTAGISYSLPLNRKKTYILEPEIYYNFWFFPQASDLSWNVHTIRAGFAFKYKEPPPPPPPPPPPLPPPYAPNPETPSSPSIFADISATQLDSNKMEKKEVSLKIEDFISLNMRPLLNYIFFDENSSEIPSRYIKLERNQTENFTMKLLGSLDVLQTYYHVLNIIGKRLKDNPETRITLVGTNSDINLEKKNKELSNARAETIRDYFANTWGIDNSRMKIESRNLPKQPSNKKDPAGPSENRRVEILTKDWLITEPVITIDTIRRIENSTLKFTPKVSAEAGLAKWEFSVEQNGKTFVNERGNNKLPNEFNWNISEKDNNSPKKGGIISYRLAIEDSVGQSFKTEDKYLNVEQLTIDNKRINKLEDKEFEYYSLILFDFGKSTLGSEHKKVVDFVNQRIQENSQIKILGFTDSMGEEKINRRISLNRAKAVAKRLNLPDALIDGVGEESLLFDNELPEGRFYCRTVQINIETPIK